MATRKLSVLERKRLFEPLFRDVRRRLARMSKGDPSLLFALRRKLYKELVYDERGKPATRKRLKALRFKMQHAKCSICHKKLPAKGAVLDRLMTMKLYTAANTRLLCPECDRRLQERRGYRG